MNSAPMTYGNFEIERTYDAPPERLFAAFTQPELKAQWFVGPDGWNLLRRELDCREGGVETLHGQFASGMETLFRARYHRVIPNAQLAYVYDLYLDQKYYSLSLCTVEIVPAAGGTQMRYAERIVFFDGTEGKAGTESRIKGTQAHFDRMAEKLELRIVAAR